MDLLEYIGDNFDNILENSNEFIGSNTKKKVQINLQNNQIKEFMDSDDEEYMNYNSEFFDEQERINKQYNLDEIDEIDEIDKIDEIDEINNLTECEQIYPENYEDDEENQEIIDDENDFLGELHQKKYENKLHKTNIIKMIKEIKQNDLENIENYENKYNIIDEINLPEEDIDSGEYYFNLINIFNKYYNNKYDKIEHFFSNIKDIETGTSNQMEMFFDAIMEYKIVENKFGLNIEHVDKTDENKLAEITPNIISTYNKSLISEIIYDENETEKIRWMFENWENQIYMFELEGKNKIIMYSPSLLACFNYIYQNNIFDENWNIYNLRDI